MKRVRGILDGLYALAGVIAALSLVAILVLIVVQMFARWTGEVFPGAPDYAGYAMATASFFAFAHALQRGAHIRVAIILNAMSPNIRRGMEIWCCAVGATIAWYFVWYATKFVFWSWTFNDISQGQDATPLWLPQMSMVLGAVVFAIALSDHCIHLIVTGTHRIERRVSESSERE